MYSYMYINRELSLTSFSSWELMVPFVTPLPYQWLVCHVYALTPVCFPDCSGGEGEAGKMWLSCMHVNTFPNYHAPNSSKSSQSCTCLIVVVWNVAAYIWI